jgi:hypothetical protein
LKGDFYLINKECYVGEVKYNNNGTQMVIISVKSKSDINVQFLDYHKYIKRHVLYRNFILGQVKNPYDITVYTAGYLGVGEHKVSIHQVITDVYKSWSSMLRRCYSENSAHMNRTYFNKVKVCDEWHNFQNFGDWYEENKYECKGRLHVDKDILFPGNKIYSPNTCILVPQNINALFINSPNKNGLPNGVRKIAKGKYEAIFNSNVYGKYDTVEEAYKIHAKEKKKYILNIVYNSKEKLPEKLITAIEKFEFKIENDVNYREVT